MIIGGQAAKLCRHSVLLPFLLSSIIVYSIIVLARVSMAALRIVRKVFKFGRLIGDSPIIIFTKIHVSILSDLVPPTGQVWWHQTW